MYLAELKGMYIRNRKMQIDQQKMLIDQEILTDNWFYKVTEKENV